MTQSTPQRPRIAGVLLAAGMGRRFGGPKALADTGGGPWVLRALRTLESLDERVVVVGAAAGAVSALLPESAVVAQNPDFASGMGSSLSAGLRALLATRPGSNGAPHASQLTLPVDAAVIMLVDLPDVPAAAVERLAAEVLRSAARHGCESIGESGGSAPPAGRSGGQQPAGDVIRHVRKALARATYRGSAGHPVLIGADHFAGVIEAARGDHGARDYLATHPTMSVECGDLGSGGDVDRRPGKR